MSERKQIRISKHSKNEALTSSTFIEAKVKNVKDKVKFIIKRIQICSVIYDFSDETKDISGKLQKTRAFEELCYFFEIYNKDYIPHAENLIEMIFKNIFRPLQINVIHENLNPPNQVLKVQRKHLESTLPHLKEAYQLFVNLMMVHGCLKFLKPFMTYASTQELIHLFRSEDLVERSLLQICLTYYYLKFVSRRKIIRTVISECFKIIIEKNLRFSGASELLLHLSRIISGFSLPLREEHVIYFQTIIIPLHLVETSYLYHKALAFCSIMFLRKDHSLAIPLIEALLKHWPYENRLKLPWFIAEINDFINVCGLSELESFFFILRENITSCISRSDVQVSEQVDKLMEKNRLLGILKVVKMREMPFIISEDCDLKSYYWTSNTIEKYNGLTKLLQEIDPCAYELVIQTPKYYEEIHINKINDQ